MHNHKRKVVYAKLQTIAFIKSFGELGSVFPNENKTLQNLSMYVTDSALELAFIHKGSVKEVLIPLANVIVMELEDDSKPALKAVK